MAQRPPTQQGGRRPEQRRWWTTGGRNEVKSMAFGFTRYKTKRLKWHNNGAT
jgi:hypothetical protein